MKRLGTSLLALGACCLLGLSARAAEPAVTRGAFLAELRSAHERTFLEPEIQDPVAWAREAGIVRGYGPEDLRLDQPLTRAQAAVLLYRYAATLAPAPEPAADPLAGYEDAETVPAWCRREVAWAVAGDLWFSGTSARLGPGDPVTAEECGILLRALYWDGMPLEEDWADINTCGTASMELASATEEGVQVLLKNTGTEAFGYGSQYWLYRKINGGYYDCMDPHVGFTLMAYGVGPGESRETQACGPLPAGDYRMVKEVTYGDYPDWDVYRLAVDFTIPEPKSPPVR